MDFEKKNALPRSNNWTEDVIQLELSRFSPFLSCLPLSLGIDSLHSS